MIIKGWQGVMKSFTASMMMLVLIGNCQQPVKNPIETFVLGDTVEIKNLSTMVLYDNSVLIRMDSVLNDSRCPAGAECFWAGNASVRFTFQSNRNNSIITLNTFGSNAMKNDTIVNGYHIVMTGLKPYPAVGSVISQKDYHAEISIQKN